MSVSLLFKFCYAGGSVKGVHDKLTLTLVKLHIFTQIYFFHVIFSKDFFFKALENVFSCGPLWVYYSELWQIKQESNC